MIILRYPLKEYGAMINTYLLHKIEDSLPKFVWMVNSNKSITILMVYLLRRLNLLKI